jgi:hypothetical protein
MRRRFLLLPCPSGRRWRRRRHGTCVHRRARWRASPVGNAKTHSTPSHDDGVEHKWWLPSPPPPPPLLPPWASSRRPRHLIRRRLRHATRCVGVFAAAPAQDARALRAIVLRGHELARAWESERSSSVARARQGARRKGRAGRWQMVRWLGAAPSSDAPGTGRSGTRRRAHRAVRKKRSDARIKGGPSQYPERLLRSPFSGSPGLNYNLQLINVSGSKRLTCTMLVPKSTGYKGPASGLPGRWRCHVLFI